MNLTKVAAWSEIVSSVAILATLVYLGLQMQQNTAAIQAQSRQSMLDADMALLNTWSANPELALGLTGQGELSDAEKASVYFAFAAFMRSRESHWFQYQHDVLDETTWQAYRNPIPRMLSTKRGGDYWRVGRVGFDAGFVEEVDKFIAGQRDTELWGQPASE